MAPYNSSHLCDGVRMAANPAAQLDILQNLVANTRLKLSAKTDWLKAVDHFTGATLVDCNQLPGRLAPFKGSDS